MQVALLKIWENLAHIFFVEAKIAYSAKHLPEHQHMLEHPAKQLLLLLLS